MGFTKRNSSCDAAISHQSFVEVQDVDIVLDRCLDDDNECMWLSSDHCMTPSSFFEEHRVSAAPFHPSDDDWFVSVTMDDDEPLFWPFDCELDWSSEEAWTCFSMSPRKDMVQFHDSKTKTKRKPVFISPGSKGAKKITSRLRNSNKVSAKVVPLGTENDHTIIKPTKGKVFESKALCTDEFALKEELPMEIVVGLSEFDGHEGVGLDLNDEDIFFLENSSEKFPIIHL